MKPNLMELQIDLTALDFIMAEVTKKLGVIAVDFDSVLRKQFPFEKTTCTPHWFDGYFFFLNLFGAVMTITGHYIMYGHAIRRPVAAATNLRTSLTQFDLMDLPGNSRGFFIIKLFLNFIEIDLNSI